MIQKSVALFIFCFWGASFRSVLAQTALDALQNNLIHAPGYECAPWGEVPYQKHGAGPKALLLLSGWGFDDAVFNDFIEKNREEYTLYAFQLPGYGDTRAYEMPAEGVSYGAGYWLKGVEAGILKLIEKERLKKPVLVAHFAVSTHIALEAAAKHPDKFGKLVLIGGPAAFRNPPPYDTLGYLARVRSIDMYLAPRWFKTVSRETWLNGNFPPKVYSLDSLRGKKLFEQANVAPLPVQIRYLCENWAADYGIYEQIRIPVLAVVPSFTKAVLEDPTLFSLKWYTDEWSELAAKNNNIRISIVEGSACNVMQDRLPELNRLLADFLSN
jgi:pimeloyl-ACP methyl ester carboxylesterase